MKKNDSGCWNARGQFLHASRYASNLSRPFMRYSLTRPARPEVARRILIAPRIPPGHEQFVGELDVRRYARYGGYSRLGIFKPHTSKSVNWRPAYGLQCKPIFQPHTPKSVNWRPVYGPFRKIQQFEHFWPEAKNLAKIDPRMRILSISGQRPRT